MTNNQKSCFALEKQYIEFNTVYAIVPLALSGFGIMITMIVIITFLRYNDTAGFNGDWSSTELHRVVWVFVLLFNDRHFIT